MKAKYNMTKDIGKTTVQEQGEVDIEDFPITGGQAAEVEMQVGFARGYGEIKVSAQVKAVCTQSNDQVRKLGKSLHLLAYELAMDGFNMVCSDFDAGAKG